MYYACSRSSEISIRESHRNFIDVERLTRSPGDRSRYIIIIRYEQQNYYAQERLTCVFASEEGISHGVTEKSDLKGNFYGDYLRKLLRF